MTVNCIVISVDNDSPTTNIQEADNLTTRVASK